VTDLTDVTPHPSEYLFLGTLTVLGGLWLAASSLGNWVSASGGVIRLAGANYATMIFVMGCAIALVGLIAMVVRQRVSGPACLVLSVVAIITSLFGTSHLDHVLKQSDGIYHPHDLRPATWTWVVGLLLMVLSLVIMASQSESVSTWFAEQSASNAHLDDEDREDLSG